MTVNESVELLFKIRQEGGQDVQKLAESVQKVATASTVADAGISALEKAIKALTVEVTANTTALAGLERGYERVSTGARRMSESAQHAVTDMQAASAAIRGLEGQMNVRAAERFISMIQGIGPVLQAAFPVFGAMALFNVLEHIVEETIKWANAHDPVIQAQKTSLSLLQEQGKEYDKLYEKSRKLRLDAFEREHGRDARLRLEANEFTRKAGDEDQDEVSRLQKLLERLNRLSRTTGAKGFESTFVQGKLTADDERTAGQLRAALGLTDKQKTGLEGLRAGRGITPAEAHAAGEMAIGVEEALQRAKMQQTVDTLTATDMVAKADADKRKKSLEEQKKLQSELAQAEKQAAAYLREAQAFELNGIERINNKFLDKLELYGKTKKAIDDINSAYGIEMNRAWRALQGQIRGGAGDLVDSLAKQADRDRGRMLDYESKSYIDALTKQNRADERDVVSGFRVIRNWDEADATGVMRQLGLTQRTNDMAVRSGRMSGAAGAAGNYRAQLDAARQVFDIETKHLNLLYDEDRARELFSQAERRRAAEEYRAKEEYETRLQALREQDLMKYRDMAGSLFDAMRGHSTGQWFRELGMQQVRQVFTNATTPVLQQAGHLLGGLIPNAGPLGGIFNGTLLDNKNAGVDAANTTAKQTTRTADEVHALRNDIRALSGAPSASSGSGGGIGIGTGGIFSGADPSNPAVMHLSKLFAGGGGSAFGQFASGLGGFGRNPLGAVFTGLSLNGDTGTQLTGWQRAGSAVGVGGALLGAGFGFASGISQGGIGGYSKAATSALGAAAFLDPEPISKAILGTAAMVTGLVGSLFGQNPQKRMKEISNELGQNQYLAPTALNVTQDMRGNYVDFDARGNVRTSNFSAVPTVAEPYITSRVYQGTRTYYDAPGGVQVPFTPGSGAGGQAPIPNTTVIIQNVNAMDAASFHDFVRRPANSHSIGESLADHLERHDGRASNAVRYVSNNV